MGTGERQAAIAAGNSGRAAASPENKRSQSDNGFGPFRNEGGHAAEAIPNRLLKKKFHPRHNEGRDAPVP